MPQLTPEVLPARARQSPRYSKMMLDVGRHLLGEAAQGRIGASPGVAGMQSESFLVRVDHHLAVEPIELRAAGASELVQHGRVTIIEGWGDHPQRRHLHAPHEGLRGHCVIADLILA